MRYRQIQSNNEKSIKRFIFTITLFIIATCSLLSIVERAYVKKVRIIKSNATSLYLENFLDSENEIIIDKSIFFIDTTRMKFPKKIRELTLRQICSIESAAVTNPNAKIFVILVSPFNRTREIKLTPLMQAILDYPNVFVKSLNLIQYTIDSPLEDFIANGSLFKSIFIKSHTSDALRLLFLWKYGGTYLDTDMIVREDLSLMPDNYICRDHGFLNGAILNLSRKKKGRKFAEMFMENMIENFDPRQWGTNGPAVFQRVLEDVCQTNDVREMHECDGFHVMNDNLCYPVKGQTWEKLFDEQLGDDIMYKVRNSVVVHMWNKLSQKQKLKCNSSAAYTQLARKYCPKAMKLCKDLF